MKYQFGCGIIALSLFFNLAQAQDGKDMWSHEMEQKGLFSPHLNNCDSTTEVFVPVGQGRIDSSGHLGFCIEKDERSGAPWPTARQTCASAGKRLPEPIEFAYACLNAAGLNNMTDDAEWAGNFAHAIYEPTPGADGAYAYGVGNGGCWKASTGTILDPAGNGNVNVPFRCVR